MLRRRIATALCLAALAAGALLYLDPRWFAGIAALFLVIGAWEWARLAGWTHAAARAGYAGVVAAALALCYFRRDGALPGVLAAAASLGWLAAAALIAVCQRRRLDPARLRGRALIGVGVIVPAFAGVLGLQSGGDRGVLLFLLVLVWTADSAAFFAGRRFGRTALCGAVSPGKTREGLYAALAGGACAGLAFAGLRAYPGALALKFALLCVLTVCASVIGDLLESLMKRAAGLKDSGTLLPGHGGVLDRIDSLTAACPVFLTGLRLLGA